MTPGSEQGRAGRGPAGGPAGCVGAGPRGAAAGADGAGLAKVDVPAEVAGLGDGGPEVSFVLPCLNEARTVERCVRAAQECAVRHGFSAEVIVADNGSTDGSVEIARRSGARVIGVAVRGYGAALTAGCAAARGRFIVMGDADLSYDFGDAFALVRGLREGHDMMVGCRLPAGGGAIMPGAMPLKNRYLGNPALSALGRLLFRAPVTDFHCGLRAFTKEAIERIDPRTTGMEFATEIIVKAACKGMRIGEAPITLHRDARDRGPHLRPWRDGWRHLRFMLCLSPKWTLFVPGAALLAAGLGLTILTAASAVRIGGVTLDVHTLVAGALMMIVGHQAVLTAAAMRIYTLEEQIGPPSPRLTKAFSHFTLERGVVLGLVLVGAGLASIGVPVVSWVRAGLGNLDPARTLRPMIVGALLIALGTQTVLTSFVYSMLGIRHRRPE